MSENYLYYGDNLDILRRYIKDETIDLVYLDPPFNSNANYNGCSSLIFHKWLIIWGYERFGARYVVTNYSLYLIN